MSRRSRSGLPTEVVVGVVGEDPLVQAFSAPDEPRRGPARGDKAGRRAHAEPPPQTYNIPYDLISLAKRVREEVRALANTYRTTQGTLVAALLEAGLERWEKGEWKVDSAIDYQRFAVRLTVREGPEVKLPPPAPPSERPRRERRLGRPRNRNRSYTLSYRIPPELDRRLREQAERVFGSLDRRRGGMSIGEVFLWLLSSALAEVKAGHWALEAVEERRLPRLRLHTSG